MRQSREDATAARVLAGAADRDVSEFKQLLNALIRTTGALRETQVEDHRDIATLKSEVGSLRADMTSSFTKVNIGMDRMAQLLQQIIEKG